MLSTLRSRLCVILEPRVPVPRYGVSDNISWRNSWPSVVARAITGRVWVPETTAGQQTRETPHARRAPRVGPG